MRTLYSCLQCKEDVGEGEQDNGSCPYCGSKSLIPYGECDEEFPMENVMKIVNLKATPNTELVEMLRNLLADAEEGKIQGAAFVLLDDGSTPKTGWAGIIHDNPNATLGGVSVLQARLTMVAMDAE